MNENAESTAPIDPMALPELSDGSVASMEEKIFARIGDVRADDLARARRKRRMTIGWSAAAATVVVAAGVLGPTLAMQGGGSTASYSQPEQAGGQAPAGLTTPMDGASDVAMDSDARYTDVARGAEVGAAVEPQVITTANVSVTVGDVQASSTEVIAIAEALKGYVASQNIGTNGYDYRVDSPAETAELAKPTYGWITIRVPEESVTEALAQLEELGTVTSTSVDRLDVTAQSIDLTARVESLRASVTRLEELMTQSASVADLIVAESALSERQAELESLEQQLAGLTDQVAMSTVSVELATKAPAVDADPGGFSDGIAAGWNGLVASLNGVIIALGFALPWLGVIAVAGVIVWLIVRARRRRAATTVTAGNNVARSRDQDQTFES